MGRPLLIVHPVTPRLADGEMHGLPSLIACLSLSFPTFEDSADDSLVKYRINTVAARELGLESEADDAEGAADD